MNRRLTNHPTALSLLLCVALVVLWVRSYSVIVGWQRRLPAAGSSG